MQPAALFSKPNSHRSCIVFATLNITVCPRTNVQPYSTRILVRNPNRLITGYRPASEKTPSIATCYCLGTTTCYPQLTSLRSAIGRSKRAKTADYPVLPRYANTPVPSNYATLPNTKVGEAPLQPSKHVRDVIIPRPLLLRVLPACCLLTFPPSHGTRRWDPPIWIVQRGSINSTACIAVRAIQNLVRISLCAARNISDGVPKRI